MSAVASLVVPSLSVAFLFRRAGQPWSLSLALACPIAIGLSSLDWWLLLRVLPTSPGTRAAVDVAGWSVLALVLSWWWRPYLTFPARGHGLAALREPAAVVCMVTVGVAVIAFVASSRVQPHGEWDAWAIWNLRARFLFRAAGWQEALSPLLPWSHPDYPLLLSLAVARVWTFAGSGSEVIPIGLAAVFAAASIAVVGVSVGRARSAAIGWYAAAAVAASPAFIRYAPSQCADVPLAFYVLLSVVFLSEGLTTGARAPWIIAGAAAGLAAWTKNEGLLFCLLLIAAAVLAPRLEQARSRASRCACLIAGAAPMLVALIELKQITPSNDLVAAGTLASVLTRLHDLDRLETVAGRVWGELWYSGATTIGVLPAVAAFVALTGLRKPIAIGPLAGLAVVVGLITGYTLVYLVTPQDLAWHLNTSVDRVLLHVYPAAIWCAMMLVQS